MTSERMTRAILAALGVLVLLFVAHVIAAAAGLPSVPAILVLGFVVGVAWVGGEIWHDRRAGRIR